MNTVLIIMAICVAIMLCCAIVAIRHMKKSIERGDRYIEKNDLDELLNRYKNDVIM